jgi:hypothetical protein
MNTDEIIATAQNSESLDEKLKCAFATIGVQVGDLIRCMVNQEIASNVNRIQQLNAILNGSICDTTTTQN